MKHFNNCSFFILILFACISCGQDLSKKHEIPKPKQPQYVQIKLDSISSYKITIPDNYQIHTYKGFDFLVDSLICIDSINNFGNAKIYFGLNYGKIMPREDFKFLNDSSKLGEILNTPVEWKLFKYENYITAEVSERLLKENNGIEVAIKASTYSSIDSLIKIISSLKREAL